MRKWQFVLVLVLVMAVGTVAGVAFMHVRSGPPYNPARRTAVANYQKLVRAEYDFHVDYTSFPAGVVAANHRLGLSWRVALLPYLGKKELYEQFRLDEPWDSPANLALLDRMPAVFASPNAPPGHTFVRTTQGFGGFIPYAPEQAVHYARPGQILAARSVGSSGQDFMRVQNTIANGTSNTIMFFEAGEAVPWTKPDELIVAAKPDDTPTVPPLGGVFSDGFYAAFVDGSILFFDRDFPQDQLLTYLDPSGNARDNYKGTRIALPKGGFPTKGLPELGR